MHILSKIIPTFAASKRIIIQKMKKKAYRLDAIKMIISSKEISSQDELLQALRLESFDLTQATLSRDLKQLKVAKAANTNGKYVYVLPNDIMYKRNNTETASEMLMNNGFVSLQFSGNIAVIRTRPGYASSMAYDIDNRECPSHPGNHRRRRHHHAGSARSRLARRSAHFPFASHPEFTLTTYIIRTE